MDCTNKKTIFMDFFVEYISKIYYNYTNTYLEEKLQWVLLKALN